MTDPYADLRRAFTVRRMALGYTKKDLAELMGVSASTVGNLESAAVALPTEQLLRWAQALDCQLHFAITVTFGGPLPQAPRLYDVTPTNEEAE